MAERSNWAKANAPFLGIPRMHLWSLDGRMRVLHRVFAFWRRFKDTHAPQLRAWSADGGRSGVCPTGNEASLLTGTRRSSARGQFVTERIIAGDAMRDEDVLWSKNKAEGTAVDVFRR